MAYYDFHHALLYRSRYGRSHHRELHHSGYDLCARAGCPRVPKLAAHMFVFYFGIVADITPPVALAAFAGSGIAGSNPMKTGFTATRLGIAAYIVPYMFVLNPILVLVNVNNLSTGVFVLMAIKAVVTAFIGMVGLASGSSGFFKAPCNLLERIVLIASGLLLIDPGTLTDIAGIGIILLIYFIQKAERSGQQSLDRWRDEVNTCRRLWRSHEQASPLSQLLKKASFSPCREGFLKE